MWIGNQKKKKINKTSSFGSQSEGSDKGQNSKKLLDVIQETLKFT